MFPVIYYPHIPPPPMRLCQKYVHIALTSFNNKVKCHLHDSCNKLQTLASRALCAPPPQQKISRQKPDNPILKDIEL